MNSPLLSSSAVPFYGFESGRFFPQQATPPDEMFDDENQVPTPSEFEAIVEDYLNNLSPKKRDKALVDQQRYQLIQQVLRDPRNTAISTAQFRFWVKKMFQLKPGSLDLVCHDNKPVAMKEQIYMILVKAHREAHHGGRDKTSALVRRRFSWIPKELVARFVRHCPFCITRRNGGQSPGVFSKGSLNIDPRYASVSQHHQHQQQVRSMMFGDGMPQLMCTPSMQEESDFSSSGPPSTENSYDTSPHYMTSPPRRAAASFFNTLYDQRSTTTGSSEEDDLLRLYSYQPSSPPPQTALAAMAEGLRSPQQQPQQAQSTHPPPQSPPPLFYHNQYLSYPSYYYPNVLGIGCDTGAAAAAAAAAVAVKSTESPPSTHAFIRSATDSNDILAHQGHPFSHAPPHFPSYAASAQTDNAFDADL